MFAAYTKQITFWAKSPQAATSSSFRTSGVSESSSLRRPGVWKHKRKKTSSSKVELHIMRLIGWRKCAQMGSNEQNEYSNISLTITKIVQNSTKKNQNTYDSLCSLLPKQNKKRQETSNSIPSWQQPPGGGFTPPSKPLPRWQSLSSWRPPPELPPFLGRAKETANG